MDHRFIDALREVAGEFATIDVAAKLAHALSLAFAWKH
jgi:hypothetical protein